MNLLMVTPQTAKLGSGGIFCCNFKQNWTCKAKNVSEHFYTVKAIAEKLSLNDQVRHIWSKRMQSKIVGDVNITSICKIENHFSKEFSI